MNDLVQYIFPTPTELREVENLKTPRLVLNTPILAFFPLEYARAFHLIWRQKDMFGGMTHVRGINGRPTRVLPTGEREYMMRPGVYGDYMALDEFALTMRAAAAQADQPVSVNDLVTACQDQLLVRRFNRIEWSCWQVALYGHFVVQDVRGVITHRDAYPIQSYVAPVAWSDLTNGRPMFDLGQIQLLGRGSGTNFGRRARAFANRVMANTVNSNINPADLGGKKVGGGNNISTLTDANNIFMGNDLPQIEVYDETYLDASNNVVNYIPDGKVVIFGALNNGETIGNFRFVYIANNAGGAPGPYMKVITKDQQVPVEVEVHDGFNGGPVVYYPGSIVTMDVF